MNLSINQVAASSVQLGKQSFHIGKHAFVYCIEAIRNIAFNIFQAIKNGLNTFYHGSKKPLSIPSHPMPAKEKEKDWGNYYKNTMHLIEPHRTALLAHKYFQHEKCLGGQAADLGAGAGRDTVFLLKQGWNVLALDAQQEAIHSIQQKIDQVSQQHLKTVVSSFSQMTLPKDLDLINASLSLPFCPPKEFPHCWAKIVEHLRVGGRFAGHFFGQKDAWANNPELTIHSHEGMLQLFAHRFKIEYMQIEEGLTPCANGGLDFSQVYSIIARKTC
jgi:ubiquinone/menaquinone biosynthesis C-methylase UbiE